MSDVAIVPAGTRRAAITGVTLPVPPPTRIYLSGYEYAIQAPRVPLPPISQVVRCILNWVMASGRIARNIFYVQAPTPFNTSNSSQLATLAQALFNSLTTSPVNMQGNITSATTIQGVTCLDAGGTTAQGLSTGTPVAGNAVGNTMPPQMAVVLSWQITSAYRGGKPRWYIPGVPTGAENVSGGAGISPTYAVQYEASGTQFMNYVNTASILGVPGYSLGTVSYHSGHAVRPTPLFRPFVNCSVHERLDNQRRRGGPENIWPTVP